MDTRLIIVGGTKGGPGKSTIAQQVAACLQLKKKKRVHVTDIDIQRTTTTWCEDRRGNKKLELLPFAFVGNEIIKHLQSLNGRYEYIVVDAGGFDSEIQREAMLIADAILIPLRPKRRDLKSLRDIDPVLESVKAENPEVKIRVVMNQCPSLPSQVSRILASKEIVESFGIEAVPVNIYNRNIYDDAEEAGRSVFEMKGKERDKKAEDEIEELVDYLISLEG
ncbi:plasmid stability protein [Klebsiella pneumoniae]|jgi:chromosome partitioning protein|uniref:Plasmid stability protein n=1 Tax=Klebsiella pneumoniae TaxID=573 RepID=A0A483IXB9_KLEPN|nr:MULTISPECIES: AAA family ATPase [Klebsiella]HBR8102000.1 AAA family ATPase [Klebsiella variicola subsp. variicola]HCI5972285.1 AAA family ATPase [Klebsiella quasipneumoniae subsp. similipneumoniae]HDG7717263.1 AAA family ATPase [Klebsiella quasipneumoniae]HDS4283167.1 AAA family ATPase [Klebsiella pneumoniae subsp. pneumoniae]EKV0307877.1 AAA family ATPase [Klebsiella pneumoniae]